MTLQTILDFAATLATGGRLEVYATDSDRQALAKDLDLAEVSKLEVSIATRIWRKEGYALVVQGRVDVVQTCIVSLEPVLEKVELSFERKFLPADEVEDMEDISVELELDYEAEDPPEPMEGQVLNLYDMIREELSLSLNPYPRKEGVAPVEQPNTADNDEGRKSPFAVLEGWKSKSE